MSNDADKHSSSVPVIHVDDGDWAELEAILAGNVVPPAAALELEGPAAASPEAEAAPEPDPVPDTRPQKALSVDDLLERTLREASSAQQDKPRTAFPAPRKKPVRAKTRPVAPVLPDPGEESTEAPEVSEERSEGLGQSRLLQRLVERDRQKADTAQRDSQAVNELREKVQKFANEAESFKNRMKKEAGGARVKGHEDILEVLIESIDMLELAITAGGDREQVVQGLNMVVSQLFSGLARFAVSTVDPLNTPFDPNLHEAVAKVSRPDLEANTIVQVRRRGYRLGEKLIRPAQVVVSCIDED